MSPIIGTFTSTTLGTKLVITKADDSNGSINGIFSFGAISIPVSGTWNTSTMSPNAVFFFSGGAGSPSVVVAGVGAALDYKKFDNTEISVSIAAKDREVMQLSGRYQHS